MFHPIRKNRKMGSEVSLQAQRRAKRQSVARSAQRTEPAQYCEAAPVRAVRLQRLVRYFLGL